VEGRPSNICGPWGTWCSDNTDQQALRRVKGLSNDRACCGAQRNFSRTSRRCSGPSELIEMRWSSSPAGISAADVQYRGEGSPHVTHIKLQGPENRTRHRTDRQADGEAMHGSL
jgi:hypothetical protein